MTTTYAVKRSKYSSIKIESTGKLMGSDYAYRVTLTESGGQYNRICVTPEDAVDFLSGMWGFGVLAEMPYAEKLKKVRDKIVLVAGDCFFKDA